MPDSSTKEKIVSFLASRGPLQPKKLSELLNISPQAVHRHLAQMVDSGVLKKKGKPPYVLYLLSKKTYHVTVSVENETYKKVIEKHFSVLKPTGELVRGVKGFGLWLHKRGMLKQAQKMAGQYSRLFCEIHQKKKLGFIEARAKLESTFGKKEISIHSVYFCEFYSLPIFGKTLAGNLVTMAKSGQSKKAVHTLVTMYQLSLMNFVIKNQIEAVLWVPHSIPRQLMFLDEFKKKLSLPLPEVKALKVYDEGIPVAQKALKKLEDRIENARDTIFLSAPEELQRYQKILIVDDAIGSGATINEIGKKILKHHPTVMLVAVGLVGSFKGFDVIAQV